jgi:cyclase
MAKPRMCFALLYSAGSFHLSRNFKLQAVGNFDWLMKNYEFESIARSIDELIILNVSRGEPDWPDFITTVQKLVRHCFMPVAVGGGIRSVDQARQLFENGADKVVLNSAFFTNPELVGTLVNVYGGQSIIASIDFRRDGTGDTQVFIDGGATDVKVNLATAVSCAVNIGAGELYLTSIDRDGTGMGYDIHALKEAHDACDLPIIAAGGADTSDRLAEGILSGFVSGVSTAHLFNFICNGLQDARRELIGNGIMLSQWNFDGIGEC